MINLTAKSCSLHHPFILFELEDNAFVMKDNGMIAAYLFGVFSNVDSHAYVHLITAHKDYRRQGLARALYAHFTEKAKQHNMKYIKAITSVSNHESRKFHADIGIKLLGEATFDGILVVKDYAGPGQDRVVFLNFSNKIYKQYIGAYNT